MKNVEPKVFLIGHTGLEYESIKSWLEHIGVTKQVFPDESKKAMGAKIVQLAAKRCYMSYEVGLNPNISRIRTDMKAFIDNILAVAHGSVLEHAVYNFAIEGVSRVFTAEMNRHRAGVGISEGSMRFISFEDIPYWVPESIRDSYGDTTEIRRAKYATRKLFEKAFNQMEENYRHLLRIWSYDDVKAFNEKKKLTSMFRRIIGMGVATCIWMFLNMK